MDIGMLVAQFIFKTIHYIYDIGMQCDMLHLLKMFLTDLTASFTFQVKIVDKDETILTIYKFETILMSIVHFFGIFAYLI